MGSLTKGSAYTSIREQDPKYTLDGRRQRREGGGRAYDALENSVICTAVLRFIVLCRYTHSRPAQPSLIEPMAGLVASAGTSGMAWHLFSIASWKLDEHPDQLLIDVFDFFDKHPDVPYVVLHSEDRVGTRDVTGNRIFGKEIGKQFIHSGYSPDATAVFILARRRTAI